MNIPKEQILKNTTKYFETAEKYGFMTPDFMKFLGEDFIKAPASTMKDMHNACEGGLIDHLLRVTKHAISINAALPLDLQSPKESIIKVCLLHQIGKAHLYVPCTSAWHIEKQGKMYDYNEELLAFNIGERSVFYAMTNGVSLTDYEYQAIINYDKGDADKQAKYFTERLGMLLKHANQWAIVEEKEKQLLLENAN
jgi:hypothetical protein